MHTKTALIASWHGWFGWCSGYWDLTLASVQEQWRQCSPTDHNFARELWSDSDTLNTLNMPQPQHWCWVESRAEYLFQSFNELEILKLFEWRLQHNKPWTMGYWWHLTNENQNEHRAGFQHIAALTNIHIWGGVTMLWCYEWHSWHWWRGWTRWAAGPRDTDVTCHVKRGWWPEHWSHCACYSGCGLLPVCGGRYTVDTKIHRLCCLPGNQTFSFYYFRFSRQLSDFITKQGKRNVKASVKLEPHEIRWL